MKAVGYSDEPAQILVNGEEVLMNGQVFNASQASRVSHLFKQAAQEARQNRIRAKKFHSGMKVDFAGHGGSALCGGPGEIVEIRNSTIRVKVLKAGVYGSNAFRPGEVYVFGATELKPAGE